MPLSPVFVDYALELLAGVGRVEARRMFGGAGLFRDGVMFALLDDDVIYVRVDDALQHAVEGELRAECDACGNECAQTI